MIKFQISCGFLDFDRVSRNVSGNLEREIWIKFGMQQELVGVKGPEENWKATLVLHASLSSDDPPYILCFFKGFIFLTAPSSSSSSSLSLEGDSSSLS